MHIHQIAFAHMRADSFGANHSPAKRRARNAFENPRAERSKSASYCSRSFKLAAGDSGTALLRTATHDSGIHSGVVNMTGMGRYEIADMTHERHEN
jgi:hypothetical protein